VLAVLVASVLWAIVQTQFNLARISSLGAQTLASCPTAACSSPSARAVCASSTPAGGCASGRTVFPSYACGNVRRL
jgi:hypothetical protein